ncbi:putative T7SS-secreted protein [Streptomyces sp. NPDC001820]|uniref:putative T7SS-secreted protein n=1 Tax=Streptomyces sp. NPDC001820 TaxID=3364613 RepID=UPI0036B9AB0E
MTARPADWSPMYESDPLPGDPHAVARLGKKLRGMADEIDKQACNIRALSSVEGWDSDAGRAFHDVAGDTAGRLKKAYDRYDEAASALGTQVEDGASNEYASELDRAQRIADKALQEFRETEIDYKAAVQELEKYKGTVPSQSDHAERTRQEKKRDDAAHIMAQCRSRIEGAKDIRDDAASRTARKIKNVVHHDGVRDPGGIMNWLADHADTISAIATVVAVVALVAAVVLTGGLAAVLLVGLASALSATALSGRLYDVFARGGKFDAMKIGLDTLGIIPGLGALKGLTAGAKGARLLTAQSGVWGAFTNGFAVKSINRGVGYASKMLAKRGIATSKLPSGGWNPEVVTRYIKGSALASTYVNTILRVREYLPEPKSPDRLSPAPPGSPGLSPNPRPESNTPDAPTSPSPTPQPRPSSTSFHGALAPAR